MTGVIVKMEDAVLTLKTDYGGEIRISWVEVTAVTSTTPMQVKVSTQVNEFLRDFLLGGYELIETNKLGPGGMVPLTDVKAINMGHIRYQGTFTLDGNSTSGNTNTKAVNTAGRFTVRSDRQRNWGISSRKASAWASDGYGAGVSPGGAPSASCSFHS